MRVSMESRSGGGVSRLLMSRMPEQREMQRARDRRRGHRQHIDFLPQPFQPFLVLDAETLLLVDNDQAEIFEVDIGADEPMRADDDVDAALRQPLDDALSARRRCGSG